VLWVPSDSPLDLWRLGINALLDPSIKRFHRQSRDRALWPRRRGGVRHSGIYDQVASRLVIGENISQAAHSSNRAMHRLDSWHLSHALSPAMKDKGRYWTVPLDAYPAEPGGCRAFR